MEISLVADQRRFTALYLNMRMMGIGGKGAPTNQRLCIHVEAAPQGLCTANRLLPSVGGFIIATHLGQTTYPACTPLTIREWTELHGNHLSVRTHGDRKESLHSSVGFSMVSSAFHPRFACPTTDVRHTCHLSPRSQSHAPRLPMRTRADLRAHDAFSAMQGASFSRARVTAARATY